jgi:peptide/nickel transport system substrate-binding protein
MKKPRTLVSIFVLLALFLTLAPTATFAQEVDCASDVVVQADDWLSKIADKEYGDILAYPAIVQATNAKAATDSSYATIDNPDLIEPGWKLCVPSSADAQALLTGSTTVSPATEGGTMIGAFDVGPGGCQGELCLNPMRATAGLTWLEKYYSHLVTYSDTSMSAIAGDLAEDWDVAGDGVTWTFRLREGLTWHDGEPVTADDVRFTLELYADPAQQAVNAGTVQNALVGGTEYGEGTADSISGVEVIDERTIQLTTPDPNAAFLDLMTRIFILPEHSLGQIPRDQILESDWWTTNPIGTGPFKFVQYQPDQSIELERFDDYWRGAPRLDRLINRYFLEAGTSIIALEAGEIDFTYVTADEAIRLEDNPNVTVIPGPSQVINFLNLNPNAVEAFQDTRVRQAMAYAIDRDAIIEGLWQGAAEPTYCLFNNPNYVPDDLNTYDYNPDMARELLAEAGWDPSTVGELEAITYYTDQLSSDILVAIQQYLADVDINIVPRNVDVPTFVNEYYEANTFQIGYAGAGNGPDPQGSYGYFHSSQTWPTGTNAIGYSNPELDALLEQGLTELDSTKRAEIYQEVCRILNEEQPWIFLWVTTRYGAVSDRIGNFQYTPAPGGGRYYDAAESWFVK